MIYRLALRLQPQIRLTSFRSFCVSDQTTEKQNKLNEKLKNLDTSPNSPIGVMDRTPKKEKDNQMKSSEANAYEKFPDNINPSTGEVNGPTGPEPTRYGDWEKRGRCIDF